MLNPKTDNLKYGILKLEYPFYTVGNSFTIEQNCCYLALNNSIHKNRVMVQPPYKENMCMFHLDVTADKKHYRLQRESCVSDYFFQIIPT